MMDFNTEAIHSDWLTSAEQFAWSVGGHPSNAAVIAPISEAKIVIPMESSAQNLIDAILHGDEVEHYQCIGIIPLPNNSANLIMTMARHTLASPVPSKVKDLGHEMEQETFCLGELIFSSFPRDPESNIFKMNMGALFVSGWDEDEEEDYYKNRDLYKEFALHRRFAGLGVILMNETRNILDELASDEEVVRMATDKELFISFLREPR